MSKLIKLPGLIDIHVHLRDPGQTYKEDFYTGTSAALAGGVTTVFDMPNNLEPIFTIEKLQAKEEIAKKEAVCDWGLYFGTNGRNIKEFSKVIDKVIGLKLYLSLTTGKYVVSDQDMTVKIFNNWPKTKVLVIHAEGERIDLAIRMAERFGNKIHLTHISTKAGLEEIIEAKNNKLEITCDVTPHHLFLTADDLTKLNGFGFVKPQLATKSDQDFLWENLDKIDCLASDHAPHTLKEKKSENPPPGIPGLETMLPLLLTAVFQGRINIGEIIRLTNSNPQKIFDISQRRETFVEVDLDEKYIIENKNLFTKCGWSPYEGWEVQGKIESVYIRGKKVFSDGKLLVSPGFGRNILA